MTHLAIKTPRLPIMRSLQLTHRRHLGWVRAYNNVARSHLLPSWQGHSDLDRPPWRHNPNHWLRAKGRVLLPPLSRMTSPSQPFQSVFPSPITLQLGCPRLTLPLCTLFLCTLLNSSLFLLHPAQFCTPLCTFLTILHSSSMHLAPQHVCTLFTSWNLHLFLNPNPHSAPVISIVSVLTSLLKFLCTRNLHQKPPWVNFV